MAGQFWLWFRLPRKPRVLWHAAQICDMGDGFTSPPPQGRHAVDFFALKIRRLRPGSNLRSWVPEASMLTTRPPKPQTINKYTNRINWMYWHIICLGKRKRNTKQTNIHVIRPLVRDSNSRPSKHKAGTRASIDRWVDFSTVFVKKLAQNRKGWQTTRLRVKRSARTQ